MATNIINSVVKTISLTWLIGPIFDKELRVSSRRKRNYILRFAYLMLLTIFVTLAWTNFVEYGGSATMISSRMSDAGKMIITFVIWFQFCATQFVAAIMMSTSISEEVNRRTLGVLISTPITCFQIVMGKLFSKLLQLFLLIAIALPLLAVVRIFGGVPWDYLIHSLVLILTTLLLVASVSMFFSILFRKAFVVIIMTLLVFVVLYLLVPLIVILLAQAEITYHVLDFLNYFRIHSGIDWELLGETLLAWFNPWFCLALETDKMINAMGRIPPYWIVASSINCIASIVVISKSVRKINTVSLRHNKTEDNSNSSTLPNRDIHHNHVVTKPLRTVGSHPVIWKELASPLFGAHKNLVAIFTAVFASLLVIAYILCFFVDLQALVSTKFHATCTGVLMIIGMFFTIIISAASITSEKESGTWPLLLATTLEDRRIVIGKSIGVLRRSLVPWSLLMIYLILFSMMHIVHYVAVIQVLFLASSIIIFLTGISLYTSIRSHRTSTSVVVVLTLCLAIWAIIPFVFGLIDSHNTDRLGEAYYAMTPIGAMFNVLETAIATTDFGSSFFEHKRYLMDSSLLVLKCVILYASAGLFFAWQTQKRLRKDIY